MRPPIPREAAFQIPTDEQPAEGPYLRGNGLTIAVSLRHQGSESPHGIYAVEPQGPTESGVGSFKDTASFTTVLLHL